ncbi:MAG: hypothetical protein QM271_01835 [Bacillota bacterium]|nr:hypothetical protein [Bacillota bacterium]
MSPIWRVERREEGAVAGYAVYREMDGIDCVTIDECFGLAKTRETAQRMANLLNEQARMGKERKRVADEVVRLNSELSRMKSTNERLMREDEAVQRWMRNYKKRAQRVVTEFVADWIIEEEAKTSD